MEYPIGTAVEVRLLPAGNPFRSTVVQRDQRSIWLAPVESSPPGSPLQVSTHDSTLLAEVQSTFETCTGRVAMVRVEHGFRREVESQAANARTRVMMAAAASAASVGTSVIRSGPSAVPASASQTAEQNKRLVRMLVDEVWNAGNMAAIPELIHPEHENHDPASPRLGRGPEGYRELVNLYRIAPNIRFKIEDSLAEGDRVATRWTVTSGYSVALTGTTVHRISAGKIIESWGNWDALGLAQNMTGRGGR